MAGQQAQFVETMTILAPILFARHYTTIKARGPAHHQWLTVQTAMFAQAISLPSMSCVEQVLDNMDGRK